MIERLLILQEKFQLTADPFFISSSIFHVLVDSVGHVWVGFIKVVATRIFQVLAILSINVSSCTNTIKIFDQSSLLYLQDIFWSIVISMDLFITLLQWKAISGSIDPRHKASSFWLFQEESRNDCSDTAFHPGLVLPVGSLLSGWVAVILTRQSQFESFRSLGS